MNKITFITLFAVLQLLLVDTSKAQNAQQINTQKMAAVLYYIDNFYVDSANTSKIVEDAIIAALKELDPHSAYISKTDVEKANEPLIGSFDGIGVTFQLINDTITVISPIPDGPSDKVGIIAGDKIVYIDDEPSFGKKVDNEYVQKHLRGPKGSRVKLGIRRGSDKDIIDFDVVRDKIPINSINASFMINDKIGYIKLDRFAKETITEFTTAMNELIDNNMESLILDLRGNSGGYLNTAIELVDQFLDQNKLIVYTEGEKSRRMEWKSSHRGLFTSGNLAVLIDEGSASASEIVSGAIQDWDRGIVIGRRSFGKGLVQRPFELPDGSIIRLTTARYHTPTGRFIQRPYENGTEEYYKELTKRLEHGEYFHADSIQFPDSLLYRTNNGRIVYGGGGIMPDIFIPIDTSFNSKLYTNIVRKGLLNKLAVDFSMTNRKDLLKTYYSIDKFIDKFNIDDNMINKLAALAEEEKIEWKNEEYLRSEKYIKLQLKAMIARNLWNTEQYYQVVMSEDSAIQKAVSILNDKRYNNLLSEQSPYNNKH